MAFLLPTTRRAASATLWLPLLALGAALGLAGCGGGYNSVVESRGPVTAADGTFQVTILNGGNRRVVGNFDHLPPANRVNENLTTYVLWFRDQNGNNVWFVGNARYLIGEGVITLDLQLVSGGEFMGPLTANRAPAGSVQITARNCNLLELVYDLSPVGLGQATVAVVRLVGLETAGYTCQDHESRTL